MKKMKLIGRCLLVTLIFIPFIQSCDLDDDGYHYADKFTIATIKAVSEAEDNDEFYFLIDGGSKLYPAEIFIHNYKWKDGQRVFVYYDELAETEPGYDYNGRIVDIENILTKNVIDMDEETVDSIGNDRANITFAWYAGDHINIQFEFMGTNEPKELHMVNLVRNEMEEIQEEDGYLILEFRHNAYDDYPYKGLKGIVSFRPPFAKDETKEYKGVKIKTHTIYGGVEYSTVNFAKEESRIINGQTSILK